jgi:F-type H+-transporting ATPase subunit c
MRNLKTRLRLMLGTVGAFLTTFLVSSLAFAQETAGGAAADPGFRRWAAIATGLSIAIAAFGGALGQGRTAAAALDGIARNPGAAGKVFTPMILGLALIESLVIYALVISLLLFSKI